MDDVNAVSTIKELKEKHKLEGLRFKYKGNPLKKTDRLHEVGVTHGSTIRVF